MVAQVQTSRTYSPEEYLELEIASETRNEYIDGEIIPMAGGMPNHNRIVRNFCTATTVGMRGEPYEVFVADQRLWIPQRRIYTYPDAMVVQGNLIYQEGRKDTITNPVLIVEVLSKSTRNYDQGEKFVAYRTIATFQEYMLIDQYSYSVQRYVKIGVKKWEFQEYDRLEDDVTFISVPFTISLTEIYDKVEPEMPESELIQEVASTDLE
jgi:Uma2 family endonuclease